MKKKLILLILLSLLLVGDKFNKKEDQYISKALKEDAYSYLSPAAKEYVKEYYEATGELILTEQNKEENVPYLNPQYIKYLELSEKEKEQVEYIPDSIVLDFVGTEVEEASYPSTYDLRNVNNKNFITPMKYQANLPICWSFATVENAETLLLKNKDVSYSSSSDVFSVRQIDYASSNNGMIDRYTSDSTTNCNPPDSCSYVAYTNSDNASREIASGGNFYVSSIIAANGLAFMADSNLPWSANSPAKWPKDILNYNKSLYEVNSTIQIPTIESNTASSDTINSYVNKVKGYMLSYGGPFVGTYSPDCSCGFTNTDGNKVMKTDDCATVNQNQGHAMQIIGWNDNYSYAYCDAGTSHYSASNGSCSSGTYKTGKGAWLVRNSWGNDTPYKYVYITYDSTRLITSFITSLTRMDSRYWDNNYHVNPWVNQTMSSGLYTTAAQMMEFDTHNKKPERLEKVKILNASTNANYTLTINTGTNVYTNVATATVAEPGFYTFNLGSKNIILDNQEFKVTVSSTNGSRFVYDGISVFTANVRDNYDLYPIVSGSGTTYDEDESGVIDTDNPLFIESTNSIYQLNLEYYSKNLPANAELSYRVMDGTNNVTSDYFTNWRRDKLVNLYGLIRLEPKLNNSVCGKTVTFELLYNNQVIKSVPLKRICKPTSGSYTYSTSNIKFNKNDGSYYSTTEKWKDLSYYALMTSNGQSNVDINNMNRLFRYDKHITSWNTKADGTGTMYKNDSFLLYHDLDLYAQWGNGHTYQIVYYCPYNVCKENDSISNNYTKNYGTQFALNNNSFTNLSGKEFSYWRINDEVYYEEEKVVDIAPMTSPYNADNYVSIEPVWTSDYKTINFNANGGSGSMRATKLTTGKNIRLKYNLFTKANNNFIGWNTKADGSGDSYTNGQVITVASDLTLYAQWSESTNPINSISLNKGTLNLVVGGSETLIATIAPSNTTDSKVITWTSSNTNVATVTNGVIKAIGSGTAVITATTVNNLKATCVVTVSDQVLIPTNISLSTTKFSLEIGKSRNLTVTITPSNALDKSVTWTSSDNSIARVNNGVVTAVASGKATITATTVNNLKATCVVTVVPKFNFTDVSVNSWYYESVKQAYQRGIIAGYNATKFGPNDKITRGQLVTILWRIEGSPSGIAYSNKFDDVGIGQYYTDAVKWAATKDIVHGYSSNKFGPNNPIIRQDLAVILNNYARYKKVNSTGTTSLTSFADYSKVKNQYSEPALKWAVQYKVMNGKTINNKKYLAPGSNTTRAEAAAMVVNFMNTFNIG
ncbi:MAG: S-layer homology domain-containing protein [Bacilli bacterium]|nr:S-layer homology domain-containing protein [Bacilli bacterium]